jgi:hypothetical protein
MVDIVNVTGDGDWEKIEKFRLGPGFETDNLGNCYSTAPPSTYVQSRLPTISLVTLQVYKNLLENLKKIPKENQSSRCKGISEMKLKQQSPRSIGL